MFNLANIYIHSNIKKCMKLLNKSSKKNFFNSKIHDEIKKYAEETNDLPFKLLNLIEIHQMIKKSNFIYLMTYFVKCNYFTIHLKNQLILINIISQKINKLIKKSTLMKNFTKDLV